MGPRFGVQKGDPPPLNPPEPSPPLENQLPAKFHPDPSSSFDFYREYTNKHTDIALYVLDLPMNFPREGSGFNYKSSSAIITVKCSLYIFFQLTHFGVLNIWSVEASFQATAAAALVRCHLVRIQRTYFYRNSFSRLSTTALVHSAGRAKKHEFRLVEISFCFVFNSFQSTQI